MEVVTPPSPTQGQPLPAPGPLPGGAGVPPAPRRLPPLLRRAWFSLNQAFRRRIAHLRLTPDQFTALRWLDEAGSEGLRQRELIAQMASDPNTIASLLRRMERAGWVGRRPEPGDRRALRVRLSAAGRRQYQRARVMALALQAEVLAVLPAPEREPFLERLERVAEACRGAAEEGGRAAEGEPAADRKPLLAERSPAAGQSPDVTRRLGPARAGPRGLPDAGGPVRASAGTRGGRRRAGR